MRYVICRVTDGYETPVRVMATREAAEAWAKAALEKFIGLSQELRDQLPKYPQGESIYYCGPLKDLEADERWRVSHRAKEAELDIVWNREFTFDPEAGWMYGSVDEYQVTEVPEGDE